MLLVGLEFFSDRIQLNPGEPQDVWFDQDTIITQASIVPKAAKGSSSTVQVRVDEDSFVLCTLRPGQVTWVFPEGTEATFVATGGAGVHLLGKVRYPHSLAEGVSEEDSMEAERSEGSGVGQKRRAEERSAAAAKPTKKSKTAATSAAYRLHETPKKDEKKQQKVKEEDETTKAAYRVHETPTKDEKKGKQKKQKQQSPQKPKEDEEKKEEAKKAQPPQKKQAGKEVVLQNGLKYVDLEVGEGDAVKRGDKVTVQYVGCLATTRRKFDSGTLAFKVGAGEMIAGFDQGVLGMKPGGKRKVTIPAALGYGKAGAPPKIPPNSDLVFSITLKRIGTGPSRKEKKGGKHQGDPKGL